MSTPSYIVMESKIRWKKTELGPKPYYLCDVYAETVAGMEDFVLSGVDILPGSTVNVEELGIVFRLRNDENWEVDKIYKEQPAEGSEAEQAVVVSILDDLISDDEITEDTAEEEEITT